MWLGAGDASKMLGAGMDYEGIDIVDTMPNMISRASFGLMPAALFMVYKPTGDLGDRNKSPLLLSLARPDLRKVVTEVRLDGFVRQLWKSADSLATLTISSLLDDLPHLELFQQIGFRGPITNNEVSELVHIFLAQGLRQGFTAGLPSARCG